MPTLNFNDTTLTFHDGSICNRVNGVWFNEDGSLCTQVVAEYLEVLIDSGEWEESVN